LKDKIKKKITKIPRTKITNEKKKDRQSNTYQDKPKILNDQHKFQEIKKKVKNMQLAISLANQSICAMSRERGHGGKKLFIVGVSYTYCLKTVK
jgi:uncharacterized protein YaaN involved in tellurite resistance